MLAVSTYEGSGITQRVLSRQLSAATKKAYESKLRAFRTWLRSNEETATVANDQTIDTSRIAAQHVVDFMSATYGTGKSESTYVSVVSAVKYLMGAQRVVVTSEFKQALARYIKGMKKIMADQRRLGTRSCLVGKEPLSFAAYQEICKRLLEGATGRYASCNTFALAFLTLSWNLVCRSESTQAINIRNMTWSGDCMKVTIAKSKTDQAGAKTTQDKHVFPNPLNPTICPILALALHFATSPPDNAGDNDFPRVFNGDGAANRFSNLLKSMIKSAPAGSVLNFEITHTNAIGTHGIRNGSFTFLVNACTAGPSHGTAMNRAQFSLGVLDRYLFSERAGDCYAGRILCGLPVKEASFATVGPEFKSEYRDPDHKDLRTIFPGYAQVPECARMLKMCFANLIYHSDFLKNILPSDHPLFRNPIFADPARLAALRAQIVEPRVDAFFATGIPPHTILLKGLQEVRDGMPGRAGQSQEPALKRDDIENIIVDTMTKLHNSEKPPTSGAPTADCESVPTEDTLPPTRRSYSSFDWGDKNLHYLPRDYKLQSGINMLTALRLWFLAAGTVNGKPLPPLEYVRSIHFHSRHYRKNYCLLKCNINTFMASSESPAIPQDERGVYTFFEAMKNWMRGLLVTAREMDEANEDNGGGGERKRLRPSCRVAGLGIGAFYKKLEALRSRGLVRMTTEEPAIATSGATTSS